MACEYVGAAAHSLTDASAASFPSHARRMPVPGFVRSSPGHPPVIRRSYSGHIPIIFSTRGYSSISILSSLILQYSSIHIYISLHPAAKSFPSVNHPFIIISLLESLSHIHILAFPTLNDLRKCSHRLRPFLSRRSTSLSIILNNVIYY